MSSSPGDTITLTAEFLTGPGGSLQDATDLTITITDPDNATEVATTSTGITHVSTGVYRYSWAIPTDATAGDHLALWSGDSGTATATELVTVTAAQSTWCTLADVTLYTGKTVTPSQLAQAAAVLELHLGRTYYEMVSNPDNDQIKLGRRDLQWIKQACAYQAAWILAQPDMYQRLDMDALASTGRPIQLKDRALTLAPLARKALQRVSWLRSRSIHVRSPFVDGLGPLSPNATAEANDYYESWSPLLAAGGGWE